MASLWIQTKSCKEPSKLVGRMIQQEAKRQLDVFVARYLDKPGRSAKWVSGLDAVLLNSKGGLFANVYVEPMSPPSIPGIGETRRTAKGGA